MSDNPFLEPFGRLLDEIAPMSLARSAASSDAIEASWAELEASGFLDAMLDEDRGGGGLPLAELVPLLEAVGARAAPLPIGHTMVARGMLAAAGLSPPSGPIVLATGAQGRANRTAMALVARHFLIDTGDELLLLDAADIGIEPVGTRASLSADIDWCNSGEGMRLARPEGGLRPTIAALAAIDMAGVAATLLEQTVAYARERNQFGRPIGGYQAVQQQLAVMAEKAAAMRMAARLGCAGGAPVAVLPAAIAKGVASAATVDIAAIAHAVHGAIGVSEEHDLWLFTRRLNEARMSDGSESFWFALLGQARIDQPGSASAAFVRAVQASA